MTRRTRGRAPLWLAPLLAIACTGEQFGLPRVPVSVKSPDGRFVAFVRNHPNLDPPAQSIWLTRVGGVETKLKTLGPDSDWCNTIVWSSDSSTVSYLVQDAQLITADAATGRIVSEKWLTNRNGYPPERMVRDLSLSDDGREARFRDCRRHMAKPGYVHEAEACGGIQTASVREKPQGS